MEYRIDLAPQTKPRMTSRDRWGTNKRPAVVRYHQYKDDLRPYNIKLQPVLKVTFTIPMPKSWSMKKQMAMVGKPHQQKPDIDNFTKALFDAVAEDDSYIYDCHAIKLWGYNGSIVIEQDEQYNKTEKD